VVVVLLGLFGKSLATNPRMSWAAVGHYLFARAILDGISTTLALSAITLVIGVVLGLVLAIMRLSNNPVLAWTSLGYVWLFRGTPVLVQLLVWYNLAAIYPHLSLTLPFGPSLFHADTNNLISVYTAAILGFGLNEAAYMAEIIRAGLLSVDKGQILAARALGFTPGSELRRIVLPQAIRVMIPPAGNEAVNVLKNTSLASVVALADLLYSAELIYGVNFEIFPLLTVACVWYLALTSILIFLQRLLEKRFSRGI
jgi:polar amino acid transport system permease protein